MQQNIEKEIFKSSLTLDYSKCGLIELFLILKVITKDICIGITELNYFS